MTDGVIPRRVQAHDPVGLAPALRRGVQRVVVRRGPQAAEGVADRALGQGAEPEPTDWLARAASHFQDVAKDQLALAAGIGGADQLVGGAEQPTDDRELLAGPRVLDQLEPEPLGHEGERVQRPALQGRVIVLRLLEGDQVPQGPGHLVAPALEVALAARVGPEDRGDLPGHGRLLGEYDSHGVMATVGAPRFLRDG